ncbi:DUF6278 family protein [Streptomyces sp. NPDC126499]
MTTPRRSSGVDRSRRSTPSSSTRPSVGSYARAQEAGVALDDTPRSLADLDQLPPRWRDDPEELPWVGNDAGLYLGTVLVRTVPGAGWRLRPDGQPVVLLASGREINVVDAGLDWATTGAPQLSQVYAEAAEF